MIKNCFGLNVMVPCSYRESESIVKDNVCVMRLIHTTLEQDE